MTDKSTCLIFCPTWRLPANLGTVRAERFVRWLSGRGVEVGLVCCGAKDEAIQRDWGMEIAIRDPIRFYGVSDETAGAPPPARRDNPLRRTIAYLLLVPDPVVLWARRAAKHPLVLEQAENAEWVVSSSPPESVHVAAEKVARTEGAQLIVDMRDGWLDVPILPMLRTNPLQRWRHGRLEKRVVEYASHLFVTSEIWRDLLMDRYPKARDKTTVLTNAYPQIAGKNVGSSGKKSAADELMLLYAGRIRSRTTRRESDLFKPLLNALGEQNEKGRLAFLGAFSEPELAALEEWRPHFAAIGWELDVKPPVPRREAMEQMKRADGLLLLSTSHAPIPAKFFEYLAALRPILAVTPHKGAVGRLAERIRQLYVIDPDDLSNVALTMHEFLVNCLEGEGFDLPEEFSEATQRRKFLAAFGLETKSDSGAENRDVPC